MCSPGGLHSSACQRLRARRAPFDARGGRASKGTLKHLVARVSRSMRRALRLILAPARVNDCRSSIHVTPAKRYCAALYVRNLFQQPTVAVVCAADAGRLSADTPLRLQINSAEQIVVPPDLGDVVKAYTKEVIRRQPKDLLEFSAVYFSNLANVSRNADDGPR